MPFKIEKDVSGRMLIVDEQGFAVGEASYGESGDPEKHARLLAASAELFACVEQLQDCLVKCLTGGEVSAKYAGKAIENAANILGRVKDKS